MSMGLALCSLAIGCTEQETTGSAELRYCGSSAMVDCQTQGVWSRTQDALFSRSWSGYDDGGLAAMVTFPVASASEPRSGFLWLDMDLDDGHQGALERDQWHAYYLERARTEGDFAGYEATGEVTVVSASTDTSQPPELLARFTLVFRDANGAAVRLDGALSTGPDPGDQSAGQAAGHGGDESPAVVLYECRDCNRYDPYQEQPVHPGREVYEGEPGAGCGSDVYQEDDRASGCEGDVYQEDDRASGCEGDGSDDGDDVRAGGCGGDDPGENESGCQGDDHDESENGCGGDPAEAARQGPTGGRPARKSRVVLTRHRQLNLLLPVLASLGYPWQIRRRARSRRGPRREPQTGKPRAAARQPDLPAARRPVPRRGDPRTSPGER